jgi:hypothetical protein
LIRSGPDSALLRQAAHHVLRNQDEDGFTGLLSTLTKALESTTAPVATKMAAYNILRRMPLDL